MSEEPNWKARHDDWQRRASAIQAAIQAETGTLDLREYQRRLKETGMMEEWRILQADPEAARPVIYGKEKK